MTQLAPTGPRADRADPADSADSARDSMSVAVWTALSRLTGFVRVVIVAAVLGPTFLGNTYQFTNSLPNLVYYGLLGGALVSSLLVPALVRQIDAGDPDSTHRIAGGFLGVALTSTVVAIPFAILAGPQILHATLSGGTAGVASAQLSAAAWLLLLVMPQAACYAVIATSAAVMNAHRKFALPAAAPALENLGTLVVMAVVAATYGTGREITGVPTGLLLLLGGGTTAAVALHALVQWLGARSAGITLKPSAGWRDPQVRSVVRQSATALLQAALWSLQLLVISALANRVRGGVVAVQIALNFFFLPVAVGATPIAIALQLRLARLHQAGRFRDFGDTFVRGLGLALFITVPVAAAYLVLAPGLADLVSLGRMSGQGGTVLVAVSLRAVAVGAVATGVFTVATYACYARGDTRTPLRLMVLQTVFSVLVMATSVTVHGTAALALLGGGISVSSVLGSVLLVRALRRALPAGFASLRQLLPRIAVCTAAMTVASWCISRLSTRIWPGRGGAVVGALTGGLVGGLAFLGLQTLMHAPEIAWLRGRKSGYDLATVGGSSLTGAP